MTDRLQKADLIRRVANRMKTDEAAAEAWLDALLEEIYLVLKSRKSLTLRGFGSFYTRGTKTGWIFKFNPGQRMRALFGWTSSHRG